MAASYDNADAILDIIADSADKGGISSETANAISEIIESMVTSGAAVTAATVAQIDTGSLTNASEVTAPIVLMGKNATADVTFDANSPVKAMVVGGGGESNVVFETSDDVTVQLQGGLKDTVSTGAGDDQITFAGGSATIDTGEGNDTVVLQGGDNGGEARITGGSGNMNIKIDFDLATVGVTATIDAGDGFDAVSIAQPKLPNMFSFLNGVFKMVAGSRGRAQDDVATQADEGGIDMVNVNVVQFGEDAEHLDDITILADTKGEAMIGRLYKVALGRDAIDHTGAGATGDTTLAGLNFWFEDAGAAKDDADLDHIAKSFVNCQEFNDKYGAMTAQEFADAMFANLNKANGTSIEYVNGMTAADYAAQIANGSMTMQDVAIVIANSSEAVDVMGLNGSQYIIDGYGA